MVEKSCTLQEHLHNQLQQLITVHSPSNDAGKAAQNSLKNSSNLDPTSLLKISRNDERQQNKVKTVTRLLDILREDQSGISKDSVIDKQSNDGFVARIHGCVSSYWELLPPVYARSSDKIDNTKVIDSSELIEDYVSNVEYNDSTGDKSPRARKNTELVSPFLCSSGNKDEASLETHTTKERFYPVIRGGGLRLPGLDWNKTFRKGYTVLVWVRPTLNSTLPPIPNGAVVRKQVLYRFASSLHDNAVGSVGVCAIFGQWQAISCENYSGDSSRMLTTTVTAYTLPNSDPMSHLYPISKTATQSTNSNDSNVGSKDENVHERNMKYFHQHKPQKQNTASNKGRLLKEKKTAKHSGLSDIERSSRKDEISTLTGGYVTAQLTLPADEWSLISIQHTHPYLRRPELMISVNGEEVSKGELSYPVLDTVVSSEDEDLADGVDGISMSGSFPASSKGPNGDVTQRTSATFLSDIERKMLKRRGILAECTLLDGAFENGVLTDTIEGNGGDDDNDLKLNCVLSVHSLALLSGIVPNVVLAMIAERGPMGDSASGSGLSFLLGPVPTNPQNRDAVVALLAGYGYYGNGGGGPSIGESGHKQDKFATPPRFIGLPTSIGISPGVTLRRGTRPSHDSSTGGSDAKLNAPLDSWIGSEKEHDAHIVLQGLIGRTILSFHAGDTRCLGQTDTDNKISRNQGRIICLSSAAPSYIGGADEVPKVGIVRPTSPIPHTTSARMEVTGNSRYHNLTLTYIRNEEAREEVRISHSADNSSKYDDRPPVSFTNALHASNVLNCALLPFRLSLPRTGGDEVNSTQQTLQFESFIHLSDLLSNQGQLAGLLIELISETIFCGGSALRDEALQNGIIHALTNLLRRVLIRGMRLGLTTKKDGTSRLANKAGLSESIDYDHDHNSSCPDIIPPVIRKSLIGLIDVCCGPITLNVDSLSTRQPFIIDPYRGLLRVRRTSDLALSVIFGLALDFDLVGKDMTASASIVEAVAHRYCHISATLLNSKRTFHEEPLYGSLLRSQTNIQYFLDSVRVRFDNSVSKHVDRYSNEEREALKSIADALSDMLYSMLVSSLTSSSGSAVTRGERDIGALVATLTECPFGTICSRVVTSTIAKLLVKCGVFSSQCLEQSLLLNHQTHWRRDTAELALENRLARNMLLCHYHDVVGPLILSKSAPNCSTEYVPSNENDEAVLSFNVGVRSNVSVPLDWTYDWRLSFLAFSWLSSLAGPDERLSSSRAAGGLVLEAAKNSSLNGALLEMNTQRTTAESHILTVLSQFLVLRPSEHKDITATVNKAETTSRRLSVFIHMVPGITRLILSPSLNPSKPNIDTNIFVISDQTAVETELLKELLSILSLSIQSLYGSKKEGLLTAKSGSNEAIQRNRAKCLFVEAAKEYAPIMLQVVSILEKPLKTCRKENTSVLQEKASPTSIQVAHSNVETVARKRTRISDKDWVDVDFTSKPSPDSKAEKEPTIKLPLPASKCYNDLVSCQDIALYAISRLVAQAMKYGGGEASTAVWRVISDALTIDNGNSNNEENGIASVDNGNALIKSDKTWSRQTLCHLISLVLNKFAKYHDKGQPSSRSQWNVESCSAVARLMDLVEEKKLLISHTNASTPKYSIDQVRLIKSILEIMKSGRENSGWMQLQGSQIQQADHTLKGHVSDAVDRMSTHSNFQLYNQRTQTQPNITNQSQNVNTKLLLPIMQSCLRLILPSMGIIRSEAVVISTTSTGKTPVTSVLLQLVAMELTKTITSAISGLLFSISRDIFMNAISSAKESLEYHKSANDSMAVRLCSELVLSVIESMRCRYVNERNRKNTSSDVKKDGDRTASREGDVIERLILGQEEVPTNNSTDEDFLTFNGDTNTNPNMGFMQYKGLGASLARCIRERNEKSSLETHLLGSPGLTTPEDEAECALTILNPFIENWNKAMAHDDEEQELVDLFSGNQESSSLLLTPIQLLPSDAMTRFSEAQSVLKHQQYHLAFCYMVSRRFGRTAFTERLCWKTWMEIADVESCNGLWERGVYDGGRDYYSKMATYPMFPQFARFIPSYLDHSPSNLSVSTPAPEIDLKGQGIKIVDITKKEIIEEVIAEIYEDADDVTADTNNDFPEEDLDVGFPNRRSSELSSNVKPRDVNEHSEGRWEDKKETDAANKEDLDHRNGPPSIEMTESTNPLEHVSFHHAASSFSFPPDNSSLLSMGQGVRLAGGMMEEYYSGCLQIQPDISRTCIVILTENHLILEFEDGDGVIEGDEPHYKRLRDSLESDKIQDHDQQVFLNKALRPKAMRWNISEASHIYLRRYRLRDSALEIFFIPSAGATTGGTAFFAGSRSLFIDFGAGVWGNTRRDDAANALMKRAPIQTVKQWPDKSGQFLHDELKKLTQAWSQGAISNFDYLSSLNCLSGRSYNDICQYPVFPWTLSNFTSESVPDLMDKANYRDLSKPIGALNELRLAELIDRFETFADPSIPAFMYGSHYSTSAGVVLHFLLRLHPFSTLHRHLQSGHFDVADRLFSSIQRTWEMCTGRSAAEVKELTPEFYCNPAFLRNANELKLGTMQEGEVVCDVTLPPWADGSPEKFVEVMRMALESDVVSDMLGSWIDLIFGYKQQGKHAIEAHNVFFYLTYYGSVDVASIEDEELRLATECQIAHFGQCPMQLFYRPHIKKRDRFNRQNRQTLAATLGLYDSLQTNKSLPFIGSPISYWVHLAAPPPGPHAPLISIRLTLSDRCLAVDSKGIYHFFRWAWKPELLSEEDYNVGGKISDEVSPYYAYRDKGCFVAQRELISFRNIPCLPFTPISNENVRNVTVCMSKTLFSNRTLLLVLSDGDGKGGLAMQLIDPVKGAIKGEVIVPSAHADYITAIDMDPIGTAAGQGGVGGELAVVGSADGSMTMWRFISSHYWPLRPRLRMLGHSGSKVNGVTVSSAMGICASISARKCCLFDVGNGAMIRAFSPPSAASKTYFKNTFLHESATQITSFANTPALCLSVLGFVVVVCSTKLVRKAEILDEVFSVELLTVEGIHVGSKFLERERGCPQKIFSSIDGKAVFICAGGGVSVCLVSSLQPLSFIDEWRVTEGDHSDCNKENHQAIHDIDFGPTISRPVVVAAGCSDGSLRLHALQGISKWSHEIQSNVVTSAVGSVLALPAQTLKGAIGGVAGFGSRFVGLGKEIGKEAFTVVKEREGPFFFRKK